MNEHASITYIPYGAERKLSVDIYHSLPEQLHLQVMATKSRYLFVVDRKVQPFAEEIYKRWLTTHMSYHSIYLDVHTKSLDQVVVIWQAMIAFRPDLAIAIGGGTVCDLTGFAASCYHRGIPVVLFPTTLLGIVDVCISGKTGVDYGQQKNSLGTIHFPHAVVCVLDALHTLDRAELNSGLSEVVKVAVTSSGDFFTHLEHIAEVIGPDYPGWLELIKTTGELKARIVEGDPQTRLHSLYGHVIGHAIESFSLDQRRRHGDCVAIGINVEGYIAWQLGLWSEAEWHRQLAVLQKLALPRDFSRDITVEELLQQMQKDKYATPDMFRMILPQRIGSVHSVNGDPHTAIPLDAIRQHLESFVRFAREKFA